MRRVFVRPGFPGRSSFRQSLLTSLLQLCIGICMIVLLVACQGTPSTPPVIGKQQNVSQSIQNNPQEGNLFQGVPQKVTDSITKGAVTLQMNANVQLPQTTRVPAITVQPERFTQATADKVIQTLMKGAQLYQPAGTLTKAEEQKEEILEQALLAHGLAPTSDRAAHFSAAEWQQSIDEAPTTVEQVPTTGTLVESHEGDLTANGVTYKGFQGQIMSVVADLEPDYHASLLITSSDSAKDCEIKFSNLDITSYYTYSDLTGAARGMKTSLNDVKLLAQNTLNALGATGLQLASVQLGTLLPLTSTESANTMNQAYALWFTRNVSGVPTTLDLTPNNPTDAESYPYEQVFLLINDTGVVQFSWASPVRVTGTVSANVEMKFFKDVLNIFEQQFFEHYAQSGTQEKKTYSINRITLGMMRVQMKDQTNTYIMIPVWDFYGTSGAMPNIVGNADQSLKSLVTISALDGSTIDRTLGY